MQIALGKKVCLHRIRTYLVQTFCCYYKVYRNSCDVCSWLSVCMHTAVAVYGMLAKNALSNCMLLVTNLAARLEEAGTHDLPTYFV